MLDFDLAARTGIVPIPVPVSRVGDPFNSDSATELERAFSDAVRDAAARGVRCRVLFLCNPGNPQGRCYSSSTLRKLLHFCTRHGIHLVADEIYALSQFDGDSNPFSSVLSIPGENSRTVDNMHCLYGLSKDFGLGGLRMGFIVTRNEQLRTALERIS